MVSTTLGKESRSFPSTQSFVIYYFWALVICMLNFVPLAFGKQLMPTACMTRNTENFLNICYLLSIPLLLEFILDTVAAQFNTLSPINGLEHRFGHALLLVSMFLAVIIVNIHEVSWFVVNCYFSTLQTMVIIAVFGKLQYHGNQHWSMMGSWSVILLFVFSEICIHFGMLYHENNNRAYSECIALSFVFMICCLFSHLLLRKKFLAHFLNVKLGKFIPPALKTPDDIVCLILQVIIALYLTVSIATNGAFLLGTYERDVYTNLEIIKQIVFALCAAILPGRMIRRSYLLLQVCFLYFKSVSKYFRIARDGH